MSFLVAVCTTLFTLYMNTSYYGDGLTFHLAFSTSATAETLLASNCTSCQVQQDKSAYWTPQLYFMDNTGVTTIVPEVQGHLTYYKYTPCYINGHLTYPSAMPNGLTMISGDTFQRNFTWPIPDPPMPWTGPDGSQAALAQKAVGFNCLNYAIAPEPSLYRHFLPSQAYINANCVDGLRLELLFPQCWNGSLDSADHKSHLAFPSSSINGGTCPPGYDQLINQIFYETIYDTAQFAHKTGQFVLANGDSTGKSRRSSTFYKYSYSRTTGYGYHGDVIVAWDEGVLAQATAECGPDTISTDVGFSGITANCPVFKINSQAEMESCKAAAPAGIASLDVEGPMAALPLDNAVQPGPAYATRPSSGATAPPTSPASSSPGPTLSYSSGSSDASNPESGNVYFMASTTTSVPPSSTSSSATLTSSTLTSSTSITSTSVTSTSTTLSAVLSSTSPPANSALTPVTTSWTTMGGVVHENILVQVEEVVTICVTDTVTATATNVAKRHAQHLRRHNHHAHGL